MAIQVTYRKATRQISKMEEDDGVDYNPGKIWHEAIGEWMHDGFHKVDRPDASKLLADKERLETLMRDTIKRHGGALLPTRSALSAG